MTFRSINPATGQVLAEFAAHAPADVEQRLAAASASAPRWRTTPVAERAAMVRRLGELLEAEKERLGRIMTLEMGKPIQAAIDEAAKCAVACRYYADHGPSFVADQQVEDEGHRSFIAYDPLGVVLAVMPWNFPFWQAIRFMAPAFVAGNVGLLKHASNVPQCALELEALVRRAGAPEGVFQTLLIGSDAVAGVLSDPRVAAATLTGSEGAGSSVASIAGKHIKPTVLELGGSDPFIVMPSADFDRAVDTAVKARTINNGQSCIAAKRFIVHESIFDRFLRRFTEGMQALRVGDPIDPSTQLGPLASAKQAEELEEQVARSVAAGARLVCGGRRNRSDTAFFPATVLTDIPGGSPAWSEELFGPVGCVYRARDVADAIRIANSTRFGLGASAWTSDAAEQDAFVRGIDSGSVFVNEMVASDPRFPFGGVKASGYGRELSDLGLREFTNIKTVRIRTGATTARTDTE
ncbi:MAG TPA: NAD-dependent succinate-semialdehyde dehydrogenase [Gemmatimonadaceae bacterium]|nr:NAD-dependent succinate-semialdehyde dehydrogenase [Gemmatimonadaceae bacterium]